MCVDEIDPKGIELFGRERSDSEAAPAHDPHSPALLAEQPLERVRRPDRAAMRDREAQLRDARVEAVAAALNSRPRKTLNRKTPAEALDQYQSLFPA